MSHETGESYSLPSKMPRESSILIAENAKHVKISSAALHKLSRSIAEKTDVVRTSYLDYDVHAKPTDVHAVDWIFATSALNFCFWPQEPGAPKFTVDLNGTKHTGYFALCAAFVRAQQQGKPIHDPKFYGSLTLKEMEEIFYSSTSSPIPLLSKRLEILKETAEILIQEFHGTAEELVRRAEKSSVDLYRLVVERFPSFRDEAEFQGHRVSFYKRAQIFVADLWACFEGKGIGEFHDIEKLTVFADYRVPQVLQAFGVLEYSEDLITLLKKREAMKPGQREEVEIRGCTIRAVDLIREEVEKLSKRNGSISVKKLTAAEIDYYLWVYRRKNNDSVEASGVPFHRVPWIFY